MYGCGKSLVFYDFDIAMLHTLMTISVVILHDLVLNHESWSWSYDWAHWCLLYAIVFDYFIPFYL